MHFRLNIPRWRGGEIGAGLRALLSRGASDRALTDLAEALAGAIPGRVPVFTDSARSALAAWARVRALEGRGVAVPGYVCPAVLSGLFAGGARAVPVDVAPGSFRFDERGLERAVLSGTVRAVLAPATYGACQDLGVPARLGVPVMDDAAYLAGRTDRSTGLPAGGGGDAGCWSFSFKALAGVGGGVLWVRPEDAEAAAAALGERAPPPAGRFLDHALRSRWRHRIPRVLGGAARPRPGTPPAPRAAHGAGPPLAMAALQAAVGAAQWRARKELRVRAAGNAAILRGAAEEGGGLLAPAPDGAETPHLLPLLVDGPAAGAAARRDALRVALHRRGVQTEEPYPLPGARSSLPCAAELSDRILLLPCGAGIEEREAERAAAALLASLREARA